ncbi:hypothetical protein [Streptomyces sp. NPDC059072]|uniref:hypothetical protein n=1 Tax=unclassified Streptomyces TaxID=2593676 RepID=UPI00367D0528
MVCAPLGGRLYDRLGPRVPLGIGTGLCVGALLGAAAAVLLAACLAVFTLPGKADPAAAGRAPDEDAA